MAWCDGADGAISISDSISNQQHRQHHSTPKKASASASAPVQHLYATRSHIYARMARVVKYATQP
jgi:hypothetical protein